MLVKYMSGKPMACLTSALEVAAVTYGESEVPLPFDVLLEPVHICPCWIMMLPEYIGACHCDSLPYEALSGVEVESW